MNATDCHSLRPLLGAYVLGSLEPDEAAAVREHLATCPGCAAEHSRLAPLPGLLTLAAGAEAAAAEPPSPALEERLLDAVARETPKRRRRPHLARPRAWIALGGVTAVAAAAALGIFVLGGGEAPGYNVRFQAAAGAPRAAAGGAQLHQVSSGTALKLWVKGLPHDAKAVYEVHCDAPGWSASAGTFRVNPDGTARVDLMTAARRGQYDAIRVVRRGDHRVVFWARLI